MINETQKKFTLNFIILVAIVLVAAFSRLIPHPFNFSPITALCLFGASHFQKKWQAFLIPLIAMFLSDIFLGFYPDIWAVYLSFILVTFIGWKLQKKAYCFAAVIPSSLLFYFITNSAYWLQSNTYSKDYTGYFQCLVAGLPFLKNAVLGDLFYIALLFAGAKLALKTESISDKKILTTKKVF